jgi:sulfide:quinone oxidoreductase
MQITKINDLYSATGQINIDDLEQISENGFRTIICFRPQDEDKENQPKQDTLKKEAKKRGINFISIPVIPGQVTDENINQFSKEFSQNEQPILGYCKCGGRAKSIYQAYEQHQKN